ncbi:MAG: adenine-specific methyltransferase EcoRI family protein [Desulfovibrio sp.]|nr:adenine-specific methyltransferase EcoRI family protein [Desulfovibrio sp.]
MSKNAGLHAASRNRKDEFYTRLPDIEKELRHYAGHFVDKIVFCNCDDPFESNFFKYFVLNFNKLGLKKLIAAGKESVKRNGCKPCVAEVTTVRDIEEYDRVDMEDIAGLFKNGENSLQELSGDGDFRSPESIGYLKQADIVATNPPFSLFREYVGQLMEYGKKFVIIGHQNAITYKEVFPLIKDNKVWLGMGFTGNAGFFQSPYEDVAKSSRHKEGLIRVSGVTWFTNLDLKKRHEPLLLTKTHSPSQYPRYDNRDAIDVGRTADIPRDYAGEMGVPITFLNKYCPEQFEIVKFRKGDDDKDLAINGKTPYFRILIRERRARRES